jgi:hypothetical protein
MKAIPAVIGTETVLRIDLRSQIGQRPRPEVLPMDMGLLEAIFIAVFRIA